MVHITHCNTTAGFPSFSVTATTFREYAQGMANCVMIFFTKRKQKYKNGSTMPATLKMSELRASYQAKRFLAEAKYFHRHFPLGNSTFICMKSCLPIHREFSEE